MTCALCSSPLALLFVNLDFLPAHSPSSPLDFLPAHFDLNRLCHDCFVRIILIIISVEMAIKTMLPTNKCLYVSCKNRYLNEAWCVSDDIWTKIKDMQMPNKSLDFEMTFFHLFSYYYTRKHIFRRLLVKILWCSLKYNIAYVSFKWRDECFQAVGILKFVLC